jgi:RNA polymerase sigma factor (sigma-70 family)
MPVYRDLDLERAISTLPPRQQLAVQLRYAADLTQAEVATAMGVAPGTASALLSQAREALRQILEDE